MNQLLWTYAIVFSDKHINYFLNKVANDESDINKLIDIYKNKALYHDIMCDIIRKYFIDYESYDDILTSIQMRTKYSVSLDELKEVCNYHQLVMDEDIDSECIDEFILSKTLS